MERATHANDGTDKRTNHPNAVERHLQRRQASHVNHVGLGGELQVEISPPFGNRFGQQFDVQIRVSHRCINRNRVKSTRLHSVRES